MAVGWANFPLSRGLPCLPRENVGVGLGVLASLCEQVSSSRIQPRTEPPKCQRSGVRYTQHGLSRPHPRRPTPLWYGMRQHRRGRSAAGAALPLVGQSSSSCSWFSTISRQSTDSRAVCNRSAASPAVSGIMSAT